MDGPETTISTPSDDVGSPDHVPHFALSVGRSPVPRKTFVSKPFSARAMIGSGASAKGPGSLAERLHGKGPIVKWQRAVQPSARPVAHTVTANTVATNTSAAKPTPPSMTAEPRMHDIAMAQNTTAAPVASATPPAVVVPPAPKRLPTPPIVKPVARGENMSERFIAERLLSDRGGSNFNPQIPRRVPDIPSPGSLKASEADSEGRRLVIGRAVQIGGEISGCERLVVEGKANVTLNGVKMLEVGINGSFSGTAVVETAIIIGTFEGTLKVSGHLEIGGNAVVKGTVSYGTISIANGGKLLGTVEAAS